jgi:hypothetical protein
LNWRVTLPSVRMLRIIKIQLKWLEAEKSRNYVKTKYYYFFVGYNKTMHVQFWNFFFNFWKMCHLRNVHGHFTQMSLIQMYVWKK